MEDRAQEGSSERVKLAEGGPEARESSGRAALRRPERMTGKEEKREAVAEWVTTVHLTDNQSALSDLSYS